MVFKRRTPRSFAGWARQMVYPVGGFRRAVQYMVHRMRRIPDEPHRIARGVFAGTFVNFPPIFGFQFLSAAGIAWVMRGNIIAALLCTFLSNPITTPIIALTSLQLGHWMLGIEAPLSAVVVFNAFGDAGAELWHNFTAVFTGRVAHWENLAQFWNTIYLPYLVGSIIPGLIISTFFYYISIPLVLAYQKLRKNRTRDDIEKRRRIKATLFEAKAREAEQSVDDDGPGAP